MSGASKRVMGKYDHKKHEWLKLAVEIVVVIILAFLSTETVKSLQRAI